MRTTQSLSKYLVACSLALAVVIGATTVSAQTAEGTAIVKNVRGTAKYSNPNGPWMPLKDGVTLKVGASIQTSLESYVDLVVNGKTCAIRVAPNSLVSLEKMLTGSSADADTETRLNLQTGTIMGSIKKLSKASHFDIRTPNGVAGIRGTDFVVTVDGNVVKFTCVEGQVVVAVQGANGQIVTQVLNDQQTWIQGGDVTTVAAQLMVYYHQQVSELIAQLDGGAAIAPSVDNGLGRNAIPASPVVQ